MYPLIRVGNRDTDSIQQRQKGELGYLVFPKLEETGVVEHLFTTRTGGVSSGIYSTMNLSFSRGDDPECVDSIIGGSVQFSMYIDSDADDNTSLVWKFVKDIKDTLTGDKPINAAGNEAPNDSYYSDKEITWENRRNK